MTRLLALGSTVCLTLAWLVYFAAGPADAATRYCGTGSRYTATTVTRYVGPAWDRPGYRQMMTRRLWSATPTYFVCKP